MEGGSEIADVRIFVGPGELEVPTRPEGVRLIIFEPSPERAQALRKRFSGDLGTKIIEAALSHEDARANLVQFNHPAFDSFCSPRSLNAVAKGVRKEREVEAAMLAAAPAIERHVSDNEAFELVLAANGLEEQILSSLSASDLMKRLVKLEIRVGAEILFEGGMDEANASAAIEQYGLDLVAAEALPGGVLRQVKGAVGLKSAIARLGRAEAEARSMKDLALQAEEEAKAIASELEPLTEAAKKYEAEREKVEALEELVAKLERSNRDSSRAQQESAKKYETEREKVEALEELVAKLERSNRDSASAQEESVKEYERTLASLRRRVDDALEQKNRSDLERNRIAQDLEALTARISELESEAARAQRAQDLEITARVADALAEAEAAFEVERRALETRVHQARSEAKAEIAGLVDRLDEAKLRKSDEFRKNTELEKANRTLAAQVRDGEAEIARLKKQFEDSEEKSRGLVARIEALQADLSAEKAQSNKRASPEELDQLRKSIAAREAELEQSRKDMRLSHRNYIVAIGDLENLRREYEALDRERIEQRNLLERMVTRLSEASEYLGGLPGSDGEDDSARVEPLTKASLPKTKKKRGKRRSGKTS